MFIFAKKMKTSNSKYTKKLEIQCIEHLYIYKLYTQSFLVQISTEQCFSQTHTFNKNYAEFSIDFLILFCHFLRSVIFKRNAARVTQLVNVIKLYFKKIEQNQYQTFSTSLLFSCLTFLSVILSIAQRPNLFFSLCKVTFD